MYLGQNEIDRIVKNNEHVIVHFKKPKEGKRPEPEIHSQKYVDEMQSEEPMDATSYASREKLFMSEEIYKIFLHHNIQIRSIDRILDWVIYSVNTNSQKKFSELLGKNSDERTFLDIKT